jgi:hypothetical protein
VPQAQEKLSNKRMVLRESGTLESSTAFQALLWAFVPPQGMARSITIVQPLDVAARTGLPGRVHTDDFCSWG